MACASEIMRRSLTVVRLEAIGGANGNEGWGTDQQRLG